MLVVRPTQLLARRLKAVLHPEPEESSTILGDWYCHLVSVGRKQIILCVSEEARLPVLFNVTGKEPFEARLISTVESVLRAIGVPEHLIAKEIERMSPVTYAKTNSRSVLGSITDFTNLAVGYLEETDDLVTVALQVANAPCGPLRMKSPRKVAQEILSGGRG